MTPLFPNNCPIRERTADGTPVGRCWHWTGTGPKHECPLHGDVTEAVEEYKKTGKLVDPKGCAVRSSITDQPCLLPEGHAPDSAVRFHRYATKEK